MKFKEWFYLTEAHTPETIAEIIKLAREGLSGAEIARTLNISYYIVHSTLNRYLSSEELKQRRIQHAQRAISIGERSKSTTQSPEFRAKMSQITQQAWQNPEYRERMIQAIRQVWRDPKYKEKMLPKIPQWDDFWSWLDTFPPEKQKEIMRAMMAKLREKKPL